MARHAPVAHSKGQELVHVVNVLAQAQRQVFNKEARLGAVADWQGARLVLVKVEQVKHLLVVDLQHGGAHTVTVVWPAVDEVK